MVQVAPSILSANFARLEEDCRRVSSPENPILHFDVMDGIFVPNISVGLPVLESLSHALPQLIYDVHLMILRPYEYVERFAKAGANYITFHQEAEGDIRQIAKAIRKVGCKAGISVRPNTSVETIFPYLDDIDMVLIMSVEPGFGGQSFIESSLDKIRAVRAEANRRELPLLIEVDGGINKVTGPLCHQAGCDILVAGSAIFNAKDPLYALNEIKGIIE